MKIMNTAPDDHVQQLRAAVLALKAPGAALRGPTPHSSAYGRAAAVVASDVGLRSSRAGLDARFRNAETTALMGGVTMLLVVLPDAGPLAPSLRRTFDLLVASKADVVVLGANLSRDVPADRSRPLTLPLRRDDVLSQECSMLSLGPRKRFAFLARRVDEEWDWLLTRDPVAVHRAGTAILDRVPFLRLRVPTLED